MVDQPAQKVVIVATHGIDDPERATIPLVMGNAALAMESKVVRVLQASGVALAPKGLYEHLLAAGFEPAQKLLESFIELGGKVLVCIPCIESRKIAPEFLVPAAERVKAARVVSEILDADAVLSYGSELHTDTTSYPIRIIGNIGPIPNPDPTGRACWISAGGRVLRTSGGLKIHLPSPRIRCRGSIMCTSFSQFIPVRARRSREPGVDQLGKGIRFPSTSSVAPTFTTIPEKRDLLLPSNPKNRLLPTPTVIAPASRSSS